MKKLMIGFMLAVGGVCLRHAGTDGGGVRRQLRPEGRIHGVGLDDECRTGAISNWTVFAVFEI